ncbi:MAG: two pore domain potassium channel family protein [Acidobacteriales bacterium]|nr:two pore domain potassium channel family protein [Terriglobales bacterium]
MPVAVAIVGALLIGAILLDAFETVVLPRRVTRHFRLTAWFYKNTWVPWTKLAKRVETPTRREAVLGYFGPLSQIGLLALWALGLIIGFACLQYGFGEHVRLNGAPVGHFGLLLYHSGETFFTLGYGDITPDSPAARFLAVLEAGLGFGFLGVVIGYLPTIYSSFSKREIEISLLDARAGSPPTATELLTRFAKAKDQKVLDDIFRGWERWAAEVLESHLSYPVLSFFRSQHNNQSWLAALTAILDASALVLSGIDGVLGEQAKLTFAMSRHAIVDLAQVVNAQYDPASPNRLTSEQLKNIRQRLADAGLQMRADEYADQKLSDLRALYEPYAQALGRRLFIQLPPWLNEGKVKDNWRGGPWDRVIQARGLAILGARPLRPVQQQQEDHF